jgi:hypothetical protein
MDAKLKAKWVEALRSGDYAQAEGVLRDATSDVTRYCCLGVLCNVMGAAWGQGVPTLGSLVLQNEDEELLSPEALKMAGFSTRIEGTLSTMNDAGKPFTEIADYIEANL